MDLTLDFVLADVFTRTPFSGNPLAVFPAADERLSTAAMQRIAGELNLSETVFVFHPQSDTATFDIRIFTPKAELPFAGHPTIGTALVLDGLGMLQGGAGGGNGATRTIVLGEGVGPVPVSLSRTSEGSVAELTSPRLPQNVPVEVSGDMAAALFGLDVGDISTGYPIAAYSAGVPFLFIPLRSREALSRVQLQAGLWTTHLASSSAPHVVAMVVGEADAGREADIRMFAPAMGISEDPATGAAVVAMAGYLFDNFAHDDGSTRWQVRQGFDMGRPSHLALTLEVSNGSLAVVRLAGSSVVVGRGSIDIAIDEVKSWPTRA